MATFTVRKARGFNVWMVLHPNGSVFKTYDNARDANAKARDLNNGGW